MRTPALPLTILVCTPDSRSAMTRRCVTAVLDTTADIDCSLVVEDNRGHGFHHPTVINRMLDARPGEYLLLVDDDVTVSGNWLHLMLDAVEDDPSVGAVVCQTRYPNGTHRASGLVWTEAGVAVCDYEFQARERVPAQGSACMLITPTAARMDTGYRKEWFDLAFCWALWERGRRVVMVSHRVVHDTRGQYAARVEPAVRAETRAADFARLRSQWIDTGREQRMWDKCARQWPDSITRLRAVPDVSERRVVYTVCTRGYDQVAPVSAEPGTRFILFTDGPPVDGWERVEFSGGRRESRLPKLLPGAYLPEHDASLYIDACIRLERPAAELFAMLEPGVDFMACGHPREASFRTHAKTCERVRFDDAAVIGAQVARYAAEGMPMDTPIYENTVVLRRNTESCASLNEAWHKAYCEGCNRDQLALPYALWKTGAPHKPLPFKSRDNAYMSGWGLHHWVGLEDATQREYAYKSAPTIGDGASLPRVLMATVVSGEEFEGLYKLTGPYHEAYAARYGFDHRVIREPRRDWPSPSWWKLDLREDLDEYDAVYFLDADAWPWKDAPNVLYFAPRGTFAAFNSFQLDYMRGETGATMASWRAWLADAGMAAESAREPRSHGFYINAGAWVCWREARDVLLCGAPVESPRFFEQHHVNWTLYGDPGLYHEWRREWNHGHLHRPGETEAAAQRGVFVAHLNGVPGPSRESVFRRCVALREAALKGVGTRPPTTPGTKDTHGTWTCDATAPEALITDACKFMSLNGYNYVAENADIVVPLDTLARSELIRNRRLRAAIKARGR